MEKMAAFRELQRVSREAVTALGEKRAAMVAGCNPYSFRPWLRQPVVHIKASTLQQILPRLKQWQQWVDGYVKGTEEARRLAKELTVDSQSVQSELQARLEAALEEHTIQYIAQGCEVSDRHLMQWLLGYFPPAQAPKIAQALGHLRHLDSWPPPVDARAHQASEVAKSA